MKIGNVKIQQNYKIRIKPVINFLKKTKNKSQSITFIDYYWGG
jgi:hypothetical protein